MQEWRKCSNFVGGKEYELIGVMVSFLEQLKNIDYEHNTYEDVSMYLRNIGGIPATKVLLKSDLIFSRFRMGRSFASISSLTYRSPIACTSMQRATLPNETAFYCCVSDDERHLENTRYIGLLECSKLAKTSDAKGREFITESRWINKEPIQALSFVTDETFLSIKDNILLNNLRKQYAKNKKNLNSNQIILSKLINTEFTKTVVSNNEYLISASLAHDIFYKIESPNGIGWEAIIYPSVQSQGRAGLNMIIRPDVVDRCFRLNLILELSYYKNSDKSVLTIDCVRNSKFKLLEKRIYNESEICHELQISSIKELPVIRH